MSGLPDLLRDAISDGRVAGLTLWPSPKYGWQANITGDGKSWTIAHDTNPVVALEKVLRAPVVSVDADQDQQMPDIFG